MPQQVTGFLRRLGDTIRGFSVAQRVIAIIGVAVVALGITGISLWASQPSYTPLFSGVAASDASAIVDQLRTDGVPYQLTDGGATILVPQEKVYDERLKAASAGLPASTTGGYSLLDKMGVTSSEFQQNVTYKRAMEGELGNTIAAMKGVKAASVRLAIPEDTVFAAEKKDPTASVFVETQSGVTLSADQVQAIVHLTSAAVPAMKPTDVAVVDADGTVLSTVGGGATGGADKQASDYETRVKSAVQEMLDKVVGAGNATVAV
ncbi:MAG: flagellar M-ring protein FliF, partial [Leifsonia sp.]|nr:flagellar M-ring protein FliF [Leifsonia sp.]